MVSSQMIINAQNGDSSAIEQIVSECQKEVYQITKKLFKSSEQDAQDVAQEVFIKLIENIHTIRNPEAFYAWLRKIIMNEYGTFLRKSNRHKIDSFDMEEAENLFSTEQGDYTDILPLEKIDKEDNDRIIYEIVCSLPEKYKQILMLRFYSDLSYIEIADTLEININTVKSRLNTAKKRMEEEIVKFEQKH
ncbi:MAG: RNA polymerase sigma factor, partial [Clostridia bacterium]|nr:RNA polymerase sigma factor [Clostridia bacterium]